MRPINSIFILIRFFNYGTTIQYIIMSSGRRSANIDSGVVQTITGLTDPDVEKLRDDFTLTHIDDLALLDKSDVDTMFGTDNATFLRRRKLWALIQFVKAGGTPTASTIMAELHAAVSSPSLGTSITSASASRTQSSAPAPIRLSSSDFPKFSGDINDQEKYKTKAEAQIGQTAFKFLLSRDATTAEERERDEELFNVFKESFIDGTAYHLVQRSLTDAAGNALPPSGRRLWTQFITWCNSGGRKNTVTKNVKRELKELKLDGDSVDGFEYVNKFILAHQKLKEASGTANDAEMLTNFVENIVDSDFDTVRQILENYNMEIDRGTRTLNAKEFFDMVENRQRTLNSIADDDMIVKSRRNILQQPGQSLTAGFHSYSQSDMRKKLFLPKPLWQSFSKVQQNAYNKWASALATKKEVVLSEIEDILAGKNSGGGKGKDKKRKKIRALKIRSTVSQSDIPSSEDVHMVMKSDDDYSQDSDTSNSITPTPKVTKIGTNKVIRHNVSYFPNHDNVAFPFATILDTGTEWSVVGGPAWTIIKQYSRSLNMAAVDTDMNSVPMKLCDSVTAILNDEGQVALFGVRRCGYSPTLTENEAVINNHFLREAGWKVDCVSKRHGGSQSLSPVLGETWPMEYDANKYKLFLKCRAPTSSELRRLTIQWADCHVDDLAIEQGLKPVRRRPISNKGFTVLQPGVSSIAPELIDKSRADDNVSASPLRIDGKASHPKALPASNLVESQPEEQDLEESSLHPINEPSVPVLSEHLTNIDDAIDWQKTLGYMTDVITAKTIANTTQYYPTRVESEVRDYPRQHRQKRLHALHYNRIPGRTCADTFFSSIKSIRGFTCVQLFVATTWDLLWIKLLRRESQVPGAYLDFCKEVGAPNELLTDNSKVQSGRKFTNIDRQNKTDHNFTTPHCQNQNVAERKIQDVKHKAIMVLYLSDAPLMFWCFAVQFVVDCLNHTAKSHLNWQVPQSLFSNNTVDISVFRYYFWQPIEYHQPGIRFPDCKWQKGRFICIAWKHGDPFTYRIWTEPSDGDWTTGVELVRNVIRPRKKTAPLTDDTRDNPISGYDDLEFAKDPTILSSTQSSAKRKQRDTSSGSQATNEPKPPKRSRSKQGNSSNTSQIKMVRFADEDLPSQSSSHSHLPGVNQFPSKSPTLQSDTDLFLEEELAIDASPTADGIDLENPIEFSQDPSEHSDDVCVINDELLPTTDKGYDVGGASLVEINGFRWHMSRLQLRFLMSTDETQWIDFRDAKIDFPRQTAQYIVTHYKPRSSNRIGTDRVLSWANRTLRNIRRACRRIARLYDFFLDDDDNIYKLRRAVRAKKKKAGLGPRGKIFKFGLQVPQNIKEAFEIDKANNNTFWQDAIKAEMSALEELDCFTFHQKGYHPGSDYQSTRLHMIFDVKADTLRRKARLVAGGHLLDALGVDVYSSTVKSISVKLLHVIAHSAKLEALCGDISNAFVTAYTKEKVYCIAGPEFGDRQGMTVVIKKALYGLCSSAARFHDHLSDTFRAMGFKPARFDQDVWMRQFSDKKSFEYICTHVDDFCIFSRNSQSVMDQITAVYTVKSQGPPEYYLGNDFKRDKKNRWCIGSQKYITEAIKRIETIFGPLKKHDIPMISGDHPELDDTAILSGESHQKYQMLIGILNWIVALGRLDIAFATSSLSRFVACPRQGHMDRALYVFGYLKKRPNRRYVIDSRDPKILANGAEGLIDEDLTKSLKSQYPDSEELLDPSCPEPLFEELKITAFVDSDHAHDKLTRRSITGLIIFVGRTPVFYMAKRQGAIETSTYGAEFMAMKTAVEEVTAVRYMLRCLGVHVTKPSHILGDNRSVIIQSTVHSSLLKKKHVAIAYHLTREATANGTVHPLKTKSDWNFADLLTKALARKPFASLVDGIL